MKRKIYQMAFLLACGLLAVTQLIAQATASSSLRDQLQQLTAQLQQSPGDQALREKIIALALTLNPKSAAPDAAIMAEGAAEYTFKNAKSNGDFSDAAKQYEKALLAAPWLAADYFNCGVAHEKAGENKEAIRSFNLYLPAAPNADDALAVKKRIGGLQYAEQKAEGEQNAAAVAHAQRMMQALTGAWWGLECYVGKNSDRGCTFAEGKASANWHWIVFGRSTTRVPWISTKDGMIDLRLRMGDGKVCGGELVAQGMGTSFSDIIWSVILPGGSQHQIWGNTTNNGTNGGPLPTISCNRPLVGGSDDIPYAYIEFDRQ